MVLHLEFKNHCRVVFELYVEVYENQTTKENMNSRIHVCIYFRPTLNLQGTQKVLSRNRECNEE